MALANREVRPCPRMGLLGLGLFVALILTGTPAWGQGRGGGGGLQNALDHQQRAAARTAV